MPEIDPIDHRDMAMASATVHLLSAFHLLATPDTSSSAASGSLSFELAFRSLCSTLIAIDDYCNAVWPSPGTDIVIGTRSFD